jgi:hypothetical protein
MGSARVTAVRGDGAAVARFVVLVGWIIIKITRPDKAANELAELLRRQRLRRG